MVREEYRKYIGSAAWVKKKYEYFGIHGRKCQACGKKAGIIHVHHKDYSRFGGRELMSDLEGLCDSCHKEVHRLHRKNRGIPLRTVTDLYIKRKRGSNGVSSGRRPPRI